MRSNSYDFLPVTIQNLNNKLQEQKEEVTSLTIRKANVSDPSVIRKSEEIQTDIDDLCTNIFNQFNILKSDYEKGAVTLVWYKEYLKDLKNLLVDREEPLSNKNLKAELLAKEISRYI